MTAALRDWIDLLPCDSWPPFEAQLRIWTRKLVGDAVLFQVRRQGAQTRTQ